MFKRPKYPKERIPKFRKKRRFGPKPMYLQASCVSSVPLHDIDCIEIQEIGEHTVVSSECIPCGTPARVLKSYSDLDSSPNSDVDSSTEEGSDLDLFQG